MLSDYQLKYFNFRILLYMAALTALGVLVISSATNGDPDYVSKQMIGVFLGLAMVVGLAFVDYHKILNLHYPIYFMCVLGLVSVLIWGRVVNNARRWIVVPGIGQFQPSEFAKVAVIIFFAWYFSRNQEKINQPHILGLAVVMFLVPVALIMDQPDLSTSLVVMFVFIAMVFIAGISYRWIFGTAAVMLPVGGLFLYLLSNGMVPLLKEYQANRILAFFFRGKYADINYQQDSSIMAIGSGMLQGKGLNNNTIASVKNGNFLSEEQTDFIFAVIGEELGFIGCVAVIVLFALIVFECLNLAAKARDLEGRILCAGMAALLAFQSFSNIAVATGVFPNTGLPLPFVSYGVSSLISTFTGLGIVLNVGLQRKVSNY